MESIAYLSICTLRWSQFYSSPSIRTIEQKGERQNCGIARKLLLDIYHCIRSSLSTFIVSIVFVLPVNKQVCAYALRTRLSPELLKYFMFLWFLYVCVRVFLYFILTLRSLFIFIEVSLFERDTCWPNDTINVNRLAVAEKWSLFNIHTSFGCTFFSLRANK